MTQSGHEAEIYPRNISKTAGLAFSGWAIIWSSLLTEEGGDELQHAHPL
jgi:hypothetical protein